jgi:uncharacterized protein (TIGR04255 family)
LLVTRRTYKNPPIEEALCEFHFVPGTEWDMGIPFLFRERVRSVYPGKSREHSVLKAGLRAGEPGVPPSLMLEQGLGRIQFPNPDGTEMTAIGRDVLSVHVMRPYPGWEKFQPRIADALTAYVATAKPKGVSRIGVRYINKVVIKASGRVQLNEFFASPPSGPPGFPGALVSVMDRHEYLYDDNQTKAVVTFSSASAPKDLLAFLLDIDLIREWPTEPLAIEAVMKAVGDLRESERMLFESLITDRTREVFDAT